MNLSILYRGPLSSCNYGCDYCPFAKTKNSREELADDARKLASFVDWIKQHREHNFSILFTPWGEALIRNYYQQGFIALSKLPNVAKVAAQTNLAWSTAWLAEVDRDKAALWTTYHPTETTIEAFIKKCSQLDDMSINYSVGVVGLKESFNDIRELRQRLSPSTYLWVNAYKRVPHYYLESDIQQLVDIDRLFRYNNKYHASRGKSCRTGESVFSVDGDGNMTRCHFIKTIIGNIYDTDFELNLKARVCTNDTCGCHIGYVNINELKMDEVFGGGELERIPRC
jgi:MoaA/NifB/PqqE/SkfB family radical SAM enzyme